MTTISTEQAWQIKKAAEGLVYTLAGLCEQAGENDREELTATETTLIRELAKGLDAAERAAGVTPELWLVHHTSDGPDTYDVYPDEETAYRKAAEAIAESWYRITDEAGVPATPDGLSDEKVVALYNQHRGWCDHYSVRALDIETGEDEE